MALIDELSAALKEAMKAKDKPKLDAIRQVQTEIAKKKSEKGEEANDELVLGVISSYVKKMTKAVEEYKSLGDRGIEMAEKIQFEIDFLSGWLPEQLSEEDVAKLVDEVLADLGEVDMSQIMEIRNSKNKDFQERYDVKLGFMSFFVKAVTESLKEFQCV